MNKIYKRAVDKNVAANVIFGKSSDDYVYHDFACTRKMTADELRDAYFNHAVYVDVTGRESWSDIYNEYGSYQTIAGLHREFNEITGKIYAYISLANSETIRSSSEYVAP